MSTIGTTPMRIGAGAPYAGAGAMAQMGGNNPAGFYGGQGAGAVSQVANGFSQFVQGGSSLMGNPSQGDMRLDGGSGSDPSSSGGTQFKRPEFKSPILERAKSQSAQTDSASKGEGRDSTGWKKLSSIFDEEGGGDGGGGEE